MDKKEGTAAVFPDIFSRDASKALFPEIEAQPGNALRAVIPEGPGISTDLSGASSNWV